ncbi:MAG: hypothetical protein AB1791_08670 [Chloroflexota bacterium]
MFNASDNPPGWVWRGLGWSAVLLLLTAVLVISLVSAGVFDPKPVGRLSYQQSLAAETVPAQATLIEWAPVAHLPDAFTARLTAAYQRGNANVGYGLVVGGEKDYLAAAVSPFGYVAVWRQGGKQAGGLHYYSLPWQTWPHIRPADQTNEIQVDVQDSRVTVRVNRELLWQGEVALSGRQVGWLGQSFDEAAVVQFQELRLYAPPK